MTEWSAQRTLSKMRFDLSITRPGIDSVNEKIALEMAIIALERRIPKKPNEVNGKSIIGDKTYAYKCPACGGSNIGDYCQECGQKIEWS